MSESRAGGARPSGEISRGAIDAHVHIFPDPQTGTLAQGQDHPHRFAGVVEEVRDILDTSRLEGAIVVTTAASAIMRRAARARWGNLEASELATKRTALESKLVDQVRAQNAWVISAARTDPRLAAAVTADPTIGRDTMARDLESHLRGREVAAVKIHPALSFVDPDHPGYDATYALAQEADVPVISHGGTALARFYASDVDFCAPGNFVPVLERFPSLKLVVAHLGHPYYEDMVDLVKRFPNAHTDLSFILGHRLISSADLVRIVRALGPDRVLFGSDFPSCDPEESLNLLEESGLSTEELAAITRSNAEALFFDGRHEH